MIDYNLEARKMALKEILSRPDTQTVMAELLRLAIETAPIWLPLLLSSKER